MEVRGLSTLWVPNCPTMTLVLSRMVDYLRKSFKKREFQLYYKTISIDKTGLLHTDSNTYQFKPVLYCFYHAMNQFMSRCPISLNGFQLHELFWSGLARFEQGRVVVLMAWKATKCYLWGVPTIEISTLLW